MNKCQHETNRYQHKTNKYGGTDDDKRGVEIQTTFALSVTAGSWGCRCGVSIHTDITTNRIKCDGRRRAIRATYAHALPVAPGSQPNHYKCGSVNKYHQWWFTISAVRIVSIVTMPLCMRVLSATISSACQSINITVSAVRPILWIVAILPLRMQVVRATITGVSQ